MERIIVTAPINYRTGYGVNACLKIKGLLDRGYDVFVRATSFIDNENSPVPYAVQERRIYSSENDEWEVLIHPPGFAPTPGKRTIYVTTLEATWTPPDAIRIFNGCEAVVVPSHWNANALLAQGVTVPIYVCPESVDERYFKFRSQPGNDPFIFGTAGNATNKDGNRKGFSEVIQAFLYAFPVNQGVRLQIKTSSSSKVGATDRRISTYSEGWPPERLAEWMAGLNAFVSGSRGEGWGRMAAEAMAIGRPVIATHYGGHAEFLTRFNSYRVEHFEVDGKESYSQGRWGEPDVASMALAMRQVYNNQREARRKARAAAKFMAELSKQANNRFEEILINIGAITGQKTSRFFFPRLKFWHRTAPEDLVRNFYKDKRPTPKLPIPDEFREKNLTNTPQGIGDCMILSPIPRDAAIANRRTNIFSPAPCFEHLMKFNPWYQPWEPRNMLEADKLHAMYDCGAGHFIQRMQRAMGYRPDWKPSGLLHFTDDIPVKRKWVALHFDPGGHANWQRKYIHKHAREVYRINAATVEVFAKNAGRDYHFFEIGSRRSGLADWAIDATGYPLDQTIKLLGACEYFIGIISGPMHLATALNLKCIVIINFPDADKIFLPTLVDIPQVESEWFYPQNVHLHQDGCGPLVKGFNYQTLVKAWNGELYPYWGLDHLTKHEQILQ